MRLIFIIAALLVTFDAPFVYACTCIDKTVEEAFASSAFVFRARVTAAREVGESGDEQILVDVRVLEVFKGKAAPPLTTRSEAVCGLAITVSREYVFFVGADGRVWQCSGSRQLPGKDPNFMDRVRALSRKRAG